MSTAISVFHGAFGRVTLYHLNKPMIKHAHREGHLVFWVGGGNGTMTVGDLPCDISPARAVAASPWELHQYDPPARQQGQHVLVMYIKPDWFLNFATSSQPLRFGRSAIDVTPTVAKLVQRVTGLMLDTTVNGQLDGYLYELTTESYSQTHSHVPGAQAVSPAPRINDFRVRKSIKLMTENVGQMMDLEDVASESGLSRPHFFKLFRDQMGVTPKLFWNTMRMERALRELAETPKAITEIGLDLGFASQSSFSRFFTLNTGLAPTEYRRVAHVI